MTTTRELDAPRSRTASPRQVGRPAGRHRPARRGVLRWGRLLRAAGARRPDARRRPGGRDPRRVAEPGRRRTRRRARCRPASSASRWSRSPPTRAICAAYRANGPDRCFHCKDELFTRISDEVVSAHRLDAVAYGENADDAVRPDRPGARAASNHRVLRPLAAAGLTKADVRSIARSWNLPSADKPAAPCLASRIPHHQVVSPEKLAADRPGGVGAAPAGLCRPAGAAPRRHRQDRTAGAGPGPGGHRAAARRDPPGRARRRIQLRRRRSRRRAVRCLHPAAGRGAAWLSPASLCPASLTATTWPALPSWTPSGPPAAGIRRPSTARARPRIRWRRSPRPSRSDPRRSPCSPGPRRIMPPRCCGALPDAMHDPQARLLAWPPTPPAPSGGLVVVLAAGTSDLPVAARGVPHRKLSRTRDRTGGRRRGGRVAPGAGPAGADPPGPRRGGRGRHGRGAAERGRRVGVRPGRRRADLGRLRRGLRGAGRTAGDAEFLCPGVGRGEHRQRLRRRASGRADRGTGANDRSGLARLYRRVGGCRRGHAAGRPGGRRGRPGDPAGPGGRGAARGGAAPPRMVTRAGLRATKVDVDLLVDDPPHRTWRTIADLIAAADLAEPVRDLALRVFARLADAEGHVHGIPAADVHFHEVGALDSIADVVGVCAALRPAGHRDAERERGCPRIGPRRPWPTARSPSPYRRSRSSPAAGGSAAAAGAS